MGTKLIIFVDLSSKNASIRFRLMRMHEHGLSERENTKMYTKKPRCIGGTGNFVTASLIDTKPAILVLISGYLIAFTALSLEVLLKHIGKKKKMSK